MSKVESSEGVIGFLANNNEADDDRALENAIRDAQGELLRVLLEELLGVVRRRMTGRFPEEKVEDVSMEISRVIGEKIQDIAMTETVDSLESSREERMTTMGRRVHPTLSIEALHHHPMHGGSEGDEDDPPLSTAKENQVFADKIYRVFAGLV